MFLAAAWIKDSGSNSALREPTRHLSLHDEIEAVRQMDHMDLSGEKGGGPSVIN